MCSRKHLNMTGGAEMKLVRGNVYKNERVVLYGSITFFHLHILCSLVQLQERYKHDWEVT